MRLRLSRPTRADIGPHKPPLRALYMMAKHKIQQHVQVLPTPIEEHLGEVWDPRGHKDEIANANELLGGFVEDMNNGKVPQLVMDQVREAAGTLGHFAGYPDNAYRMDCFLDSPFASSYREVAQKLPSFIDDMNTLIQARIVKLSELPVVATSRSIGDKDIPF